MISLNIHSFNTSWIHFIICFIHTEIGNKRKDTTESTRTWPESFQGEERSYHTILLE
jgi:hypothetical protein